MKRFFTAIFPVVFIITACQTTNIEVPENLTPGEIFKEAQTASTEYNDYEKALIYYNTFLERYPDQPLMAIEAEYEIALLYHKMGDDETSLRLFNGIIEKYQQPEAAMLPAWPEVLSKKLIDIIEGNTEEPSSDEENATAAE